MHYFDKYKLYDAQALKNAYRKLSGKSRAARSAVFPVMLSNWVIAILFGVHGALFNIYFHNFLQGGQQLFSAPVAGPVATALRSLVGDSLLYLLGFGLVYVVLIPLIAGLLLRGLLFLLILLVMPRVSQKNMSAPEKLAQMEIFCDQSHTTCDYAPAHLLIPTLIIILGTAGGVMRISFLESPALGNSEFWDLVFSAVLMIPLGLLLFLPQAVIYSLLLRFFRPISRKVPAELWQAITAEKQRLNAQLDVDVYYSCLRQKLEQAAQEAKNAWAPALTKKERRRARVNRAVNARRYRSLDAAKWNQKIQPGGMDSASLEALQAAQAEK